jgi:NTP-dependent ternary system trypsin peptidase co-occuring protein
VDVERLGLTEAISRLRAELSEAIVAGGQEDLRFEVGEIELELEVAVERTVNGGIKFWVIEVGGERTVGDTHTVRIPLTPKRSDGRAVLTGSSDEIPEAPAVPGT